MSNYFSCVVQTYRSEGAPSSKPLRVHPLAGQGLDTAMNVECSSKMRDSQPAGSLFLIKAKVTDREGGPPFLYTSFRWAYEVLTPAQAAEFISKLTKG
ncbi:hypothetical protein [Delftia acidovorans]|jgi:hypothetical protein|uniref:hypothetical protein n=1 Tax=Delftia acidovorans TaxID=80866 RepID=UPI0022AB94C1|nr:hypothetical protein [Delftia acidovorans]WAT83027.1 hypothetical protein O1V13_16240 [Delftia acidovorans]